jgi:hypothetical protein
MAKPPHLTSEQAANRLIANETEIQFAERHEVERLRRLEDGKTAIRQEGLAQQRAAEDQESKIGSWNKSSMIQPRVQGAGSFRNSEEHLKLDTVIRKFALSF